MVGGVGLYFDVREGLDEGDVASDRLEATAGELFVCGRREDVLLLAGPHAHVANRLDGVNVLLVDAQDSRKKTTIMRLWK